MNEQRRAEEEREIAQTALIAADEIDWDAYMNDPDFLEKLEEKKGTP